MKTKSKIFIIVIFFTILLILFILKLPLLFPKNYTKDKIMKDQIMKDQFNNTSNNQSNIGGLLIHMLESSDLKNIMKNDKFDLSLLTDCASFNRKTCSAWTLVRRDLQPMVFIYPGPDSPNVGIILNANSAWNLVTTMGIIDSNTNMRNCCQQENGSPQITRWPWQSSTDVPCITKMLNAKGFDTNGKYNGYIVYIPSINHDGQQCPVSCKHNDLFCKYNNAGASINMNDIYSWKECIDGSFNNCYDFTEINEKDIPQDLKDFIEPFIEKPAGYLVQSTSKNCSICSKPYLCVTKPPPTTDSKKRPIIEKDQISAYVGNDGLGWNNLFTPKGSLDPYNIVTRQCKWEKKDMQQWMNSLKKYYNDIYELMDSDNSMNQFNDYFLSNPNYVLYLENEVNIYVNGDRTSIEYEKQNKIFMDSIEGFFYIPTTCEKQLKVLNNIKTSSGNSVFSTASERCDAYFKKIKGDARNKFEEKRVEDGRNIIIEFTKWFNKKYSKNVSAFSANLDSNSFPNRSQINLANNSSISFDSIFKKII